MPRRRFWHGALFLSRQQDPSGGREGGREGGEKREREREGATLLKPSITNGSIQKSVRTEEGNQWRDRSTVRDIGSK